MSQLSEFMIRNMISQRIHCCFTAFDLITWWKWMFFIRFLLFTRSIMAFFKSHKCRQEAQQMHLNIIYWGWSCFVIKSYTFNLVVTFCYKVKTNSVTPALRYDCFMDITQLKNKKNTSYNLLILSWFLTSSLLLTLGGAVSHFFEVCGRTNHVLDFPFSHCLVCSCVILSAAVN